MTVATQMQQVIASIQSAAASMTTFALETQDQQAKTTFKNLANTLNGAVDTLKDRQTYIEQEEPQYKEW